MNGYDFDFAGTRLTALGSGALYWPDRALLCVSDLHLGKAERRARLGEAPLPPYETRETLTRLEADVRSTGATTVVCLGDSFDDTAAADALSEAEKLWITSLQAGRQWVWIEGNHDPGPVDMGGTYKDELRLGQLVFRHIAKTGQSGELSGALPSEGHPIHGASKNYAGRISHGYKPHHPAGLRDIYRRIAQQRCRVAIADGTGRPCHPDGTCSPGLPYAAFGWLSPIHRHRREP